MYMCIFSNILFRTLLWVFSYCENLKLIGSEECWRGPPMLRNTECFIPASRCQWNKTLLGTGSLMSHARTTPAVGMSSLILLCRGFLRAWVFESLQQLAPFDTGQVFQLGHLHRVAEWAADSVRYTLTQYIGANPPPLPGDLYWWD